MRENHSTIGGQRVRIVGLVCGVAILLGSPTVQAQPRTRPHGVATTARQMAAAWVAPPAATVVPTPCDGDPSVLCGSVRVPIDRAHPSHGTLRITFNVIPHRDLSSTATDAAVAVSGGPGVATIASRGFWSWMLYRMARERDIVLIDARGTGPTAIRCTRLQHGRFRPSQYVEAIGACGKHLGADADRYGSGDVAMDTEAVRRALGYPKIDLVMGSYGGALEQAYAVRYPHRVRSIVGDATFPVTDPMHVLGLGLGVPDAFVDAAALSCQRAPSCITAHPHPAALFTWLARRVARHPVVGAARDSSNRLRHVVVDDTELAVIVGTSPNLNAAELVGAAQSLRDGDPAPLLRLGADSPLNLSSDSGDPARDSSGDNAAAYCNDVDAPWKRSWSIKHRERAYHQFVASLPDDAFAPLTVHGWLGEQYPQRCIRWPAPDRFTPAVPRGAVFPNTPTLVMRGDLDVYVPASQAQMMADEFPNSTFVSIAGAGHTPMAYSDCAQRIAATFVDKLHVGDTTCAAEPAYVMPVIASFPVHARDAEEAQSIPGGTDHSNAIDRQVATAVMATVPDGFVRTLWDPVVGVVPGLRGGSFRSDYYPWSATLAFKGARFVNDVAIWGAVSWAWGSGKLKGDLKIRGVRTGHVHLTGDWNKGYSGQYFGAIRIRGTIGGRPVALRIPAN